MAEQAGFEVGDRLLRIDGREIKTWGEHQIYMTHQAMKGHTMEVTVLGAQGNERQLNVNFSGYDQRGIVRGAITSQIGLFPEPLPARVSEVVEGSVAENAGLLAGDRIIEIDGEPIANWYEMVAKISTSPDKALTLTIERQAKKEQTQENASTRLTQTITPKAVQRGDQTVGQIGIRAPSFTNDELRYGVLEAIPASIDYNWRMASVTLRSLWRMLTAQLSIENISGPITIARVAGATVQTGFVDFVRVLAIISISLGLLNLLPIPLLDGGHLMYFLIEAITGKEPSEMVMLRGQQIGIFLLLILMSVAFYNDIMRLLGLL